MRCPYCKTPISENTPACPRCALNVETASTAFGAPPNLQRGVNDATLALSESQRRRIQASLTEFHDHFPQIHLSLVTVELTEETGLAAYAFWLFNRSGLCPPSERGGSNHDILLTLDTQCHRAHLTFGYGLEPFVGESIAREVLPKAQDLIRSGSWAAGIITLVDALKTALIALTTDLDRTYGVSVADFYEAEKERLEDASQVTKNRESW